MTKSRETKAMKKIVEGLIELASMTEIHVIGGYIGDTRSKASRKFREAQQLLNGGEEQADE